MEMIDLFSGAGGLSLGLERAGFHSVFAVENDADACSTYRQLFPGACLCEASIIDVDLRVFRGNVELVAGGPPCQPFSSGGKQLGVHDTRNMIPQFTRALRDIEPPLFLMENVPGLAGPAWYGYLSAFLRDAADLGYRVTYRVVNAAAYGVPQKRRRLIVLGSRLAAPAFPPPTCGPGCSAPFGKSGAYLTPQAIVGVPNPSRVTYAKRPDLRPSPYDGHLFNGGGRAINLDDLCPTILASAGGNKTPFLDTLGEVPKYHAELMQGLPPRTGALPGARRITVAEAALIQTFPLDVTFCGARSSQYRQVGNAVPPLLAERLGAVLRSLLTGEHKATVAQHRDVLVHQLHIPLDAV